VNLPVICLAAALTSALTLFSGFGLGTLLMPVFALFFPLTEAVALTAVVHLLNNLFKLTLFGKFTDRGVVLRFGLPALVGALAGAWALLMLGAMPVFATYSFLGSVRAIEPVKCVMALLMVGFALLEILPALQRVSFEPRYLPLGGALSGFFGGFSGHQGAFRSAFLTKCGLSKERFIGTGVVIAVLVDLARISVYQRHFASGGFRENGSLLLAATLAAFLGVWVGVRFIQKVTMRVIQLLVALLLFIIAAGLASGLI